MSKRNKRSRLEDIRATLEGLVVSYDEMAKDREREGNQERSAYYVGKSQGVGLAVRLLRGQLTADKD